MLGILTTKSSIVSDTILLAQWIIFIILFLNWYVARKRDIKTHKRIILTLFTVQTLFNIYMLSRIISIEIQPILILHGTLGFLAYLLILYTVLFMTEHLPESLKFFTKENRIWLMRTTSIIWMLFTFSGTLVFYTIYL